MPGWNDDFDVDGLDWTQKDFLDMFFKACWERLRASGMVYTLPDEDHQFLVKLYDPGPPEVKADNVQNNGVFQAHFSGYSTGILLPTIRALQAAVNFVVPVFWNVENDIAGQPPFTGPPYLSYYGEGPRSVADPTKTGYYTGDTLTGAIGLTPSGSEFDASILWRRKAPREVYAPDIQGTTKDTIWDPVTWFGISEWIHGAFNDVPVGGRARWFKSSGSYGTAPPGFNFPEPGDGVAQIGIWEHQGGGVWTRVDVDDPTAQPDILDSENDPDGGSYWPPGPCTPGDYIGGWLFNNLRDALNKLVWVGPAEFIHYQQSTAPALNGFYQNWQPYFVDENTPGVIIHSGRSLNFEPDEDTAKDVALTNFNSSDDFYQLETTLYRFSSVESDWTAFLTAPKFKVGAGNVWKGRGRKVEVYALAHWDTSVTGSTYDDMAFGVMLPKDVWTLYKSMDFAPGMDEYGQDLIDAVDFSDPPEWPEDPIPAGTTKSKGAYLGRYQLFSLVKYDVSGGFEYTAA